MARYVALLIFDDRPDLRPYLWCQIIFWVNLRGVRGDRCNKLVFSWLDRLPVTVGPNIAAGIRLSHSILSLSL